MYFKTTPFSKVTAKPITILFIGLTLIFSFVNISLSHPHNDKPKQSNTWWWNASWWNKGIIKPANNYETQSTDLSFKSQGNDIPAVLIRPKKKGKYYPVLFQHGRRGLDEIVLKHARRLAARGFIVLAADIYKGNFIGSYPITHDYKLEADVNQALNFLLKQKNLKSKQACVYSHTRGGYYSLKLAVTFKRQQKDLKCYVSYYPHWQDPNAAEPLQVYSFAPEINELTIPVLVFIGENEQYHRRRAIESSIKTLIEKKRDARLIVYPGVGRGFDFRPENVRTFNDDLASKDAIQRAADFIRKHLSNNNALKKTSMKLNKK